MGHSLEDISGQVWFDAHNDWPISAVKLFNSSLVKSRSFCFDHLNELSNSVVNHATVQHILWANKVLENEQIKSVTLTFPCMENLMQCKLVVYSDASYNNLENGSSQGGFCIFLQHSNGNLSLNLWQSKKICWMVKSTMAAETLALVEAAEASCWLSNLIPELLS